MTLDDASLVRPRSRCFIDCLSLTVCLTAIVTSNEFNRLKLTGHSDKAPIEIRIYRATFRLNFPSARPVQFKLDEYATIFAHRQPILLHCTLKKE